MVKIEMVMIVFQRVWWKSEIMLQIEFQLIQQHQGPTGKLKGKTSKTLFNNSFTHSGIDLFAALPLSPSPPSSKKLSSRDRIERNKFLFWKAGTSSINRLVPSDEKLMYWQYSLYCIDIQYLNFLEIRTRYHMFTQQSDQ